MNKCVNQFIQTAGLKTQECHKRFSVMVRMKQKKNYKKEKKGKGIIRKRMHFSFQRP